MAPSVMSAMGYFADITRRRKRRLCIRARLQSCRPNATRMAALAAAAGVRGCLENLARDPSPGPRRLETAPAADHPLPRERADYL